MKDQLVKTDLEFIQYALQAFWLDANAQLEKKSLGDIERKNYERQLSKSKELGEKVEQLLYQPALTTPVDVQECKHKSIMYINEGIGWLCFDCKAFSKDKVHFHHPHTAAQQPSQWVEIKSEKDLPENYNNEDVAGEQVAICVHFGTSEPYVTTGRMYMNEWYWWEENKKVSSKFKITHWMSLPTKPAPPISNP